MRKLIGILALCALSVASMGASCGGVKPPVDCAQLRTAADAACSGTNMQLCTAASLAYAASGCGVYVPPTPPVKTCADITCQAGFSCKQPDPTKNAVCVQDPVVEHEPVCQPNQNCNCWVQPPGGEWAKLGCSDNQVCGTDYVCRTPAPVCPTCAPGYTCKDPKIGCVKDTSGSGCVVPDAEDPGWGEPIAADKRPAFMYQAYKAAIEKIGNRCGFASADESKQMQTLKDIASELVKAGHCAAQSADSVAILAPDKLYEEWHAVYFGNGCIIDGPNAYKGAYPFSGTPVEPPPPGGSVGACPSPVPPKVDRFNIKKHNRVCDATPQFYNREALRWDGTTVDQFCDSVGFTNRLHCPARQECPETGENVAGCKDRPSCEAVGVSGKDNGKPLWRSDGSVNLTDNPYQASCSDCTWIEICAADGTHCSRCETEGGVCK